HRLSVIEPAKAADAGTRIASAVPAAAPAKQATIARPKTPDDRPKSLDDRQDDPFNPPGERQKKKARELLSQAEKEFAEHRFTEASRHYSEANKIDPKCTDGCGERWAYCKFHYVDEQLKQPGFNPGQYPELEKELRDALALWPRFEYGKKLL